MKKLLALVASLAFVATASAQVLSEADFEDGTLGKFKPWVAETCKVVPGAKGNTSSHMMDMKNGGYLEINGVTAGSTYKITADVRYNWGKDTGTLFVLGINKETGKLDKQISIDLPREQQFTKVELIYKAKGGLGGYHRAVINPAGNYFVDNIKVEKIQ